MIIDQAWQIPRIIRVFALCFVLSLVSHALFILFLFGIPCSNSILHNASLAFITGPLRVISNETE